MQCATMHEVKSNCVAVVMNTLCVQIFVGIRIPSIAPTRGVSNPGEFAMVRMTVGMAVMKPAGCVCHMQLCAME